MTETLIWLRPLNEGNLQATIRLLSFDDHPLECYNPILQGNALADQPWRTETNMGSEGQVPEN
jgi:hypothetical protein